jgi:hypothetical protein
MPLEEVRQESLAYLAMQEEPGQLEASNDVVRQYDSKPSSDSGLKEAAKETYKFLQDPQKYKPSVGKFGIIFRFLPDIAKPIYVGGKFGYEFGKAGASGTFGSGPVAGFERTPEIAAYERSALRTSRII